MHSPKRYVFLAIGKRTPGPSYRFFSPPSQPEILSSYTVASRATVMPRLPLRSFAAGEASAWPTEMGQDSGKGGRHYSH